MDWCWPAIVPIACPAAGIRVYSLPRMRVRHLNQQMVAAVALLEELRVRSQSVRDVPGADFNVLQVTPLPCFCKHEVRDASTGYIS